MRYFCISDIHGCYIEMLAALQQAGFDMQKDTLITVGDLFDRGTQSKAVLDFVMGCPHHLCCMGNHDLRLLELINKPYDFQPYDISNGVPATLKSFSGAKDIADVSTMSELVALRQNRVLHNYFREAVGAIEFSNLIITHGWIPFDRTQNLQYIPYVRSGPDGKVFDWRGATAFFWNEAVWAHTEKMIANNLFPDKPLLIGHWHAWRLAEKFGEKRMADPPSAEINCDTFTYVVDGQVKLIAIDGCTNWPYGGKVNVYVFETEEKPQLISGHFLTSLIDD